MCVITTSSARAWYVMVNIQRHVRYLDLNLKSKWLIRLHETCSNLNLFNPCQL